MMTKKAIPLPGSGILMSDFAKEIGITMKPTNTIFYRPDLKKVVEITRMEIEKKIKTDKNIYTGFSIIEPNRFVTLVEKFINPVVFTYNTTTKSNNSMVKSMSPMQAGIVLCSDDLISNIHSINRIFNVPIPILVDNELVFPNKGYDERFGSWLPENAPNVRTDMSLEEAKTLISSLYEEFAFENENDRDRAIAALLTPACRGLFPSFSTRTPCFVYRANRERAGKDYCAGITGIVFEGHPAEDAPISSSDKSQGDSAEFGKKVLSAMISGRKRMHFSNNKGHIDNAAFEKVLTSEIHTDRILGGNKEVTMANEIDFSASGNIGITYTPDFANRCRFINLFLEVENANMRKFKNPNLHGYVNDNRGEILSAMYALIRNWIELGKPEGSKPFSSFQQWARIVGGIMEAAGYSSPCEDDNGSVNIGGDEETNGMKLLYETIGKSSDNGMYLGKDQIHTIINDNDELKDIYELNDNSSAIRLGKTLKRFNGRILSDIKLEIDSTRARPKFKFTKIVRKERDASLC